MNFPTKIFGDATSVTSRFGSANGIVIPERLIDVLCFNSSNAALYMLVFEITNSLIPFGTAYAGGGTYTLSGLTAGHVYSYRFHGTNDTSITNGSDTILASAGAGTFTAAGTSVALAGTGSALITVDILDLTVPQSAPVPAEGAVPRFAGFPVQSGLAANLGKSVDMTGIYCCWSSTALAKTIAAASGSIEIIVRG
jgi:hypothetical protein